MKLRNLAPAVAVGIASTAFATDRHVDDSAPGGGTGLTWGSPYNNLQTALTNAAAGDLIKVAQGTYKPTTGTDRAATFTLKIGTIKGGYAGYGASNPNDHDPAVYVTILSGDIGAANDYTDNSFHVVTANDSGMTQFNTLLDGFTITKGFGDGTGGNGGGGGIKVSNDAGPRFDQCIITDNRSKDTGEPPPSEGLVEAYGAGALCFNASPVFTRCTFSNNIAMHTILVYGGGVCVQGEESSVRLINCRITGNESENGGGVAVKDGATASLTNCLIDNNEASDFGGGVSVDRLGIVVITNTTIADNAATTGGGIAQYGSSSNSMTMRNSIVWDNTATTAAAVYTDSSPGVVSITFSDIQGGWGVMADNNINADPNFASDYQLNCSSPAINAGNPMNTGVIPVDEFDLDSDTNATESTPDFLLNDREQGFPNEPDMGCYEKPYSAPACSGEANGICPVDVGDLLAVITSWGTCASPPCAADLTPKPCPDNLVNVADLLAVINDWCCTIPGCPTLCDGITIEDSQDCMDAASQLYTAFTEDWNNFVEKCIEMLENP